MDRDELQDRIRARRSGGEPYRRGAVADDQPGYERFEPEPDDERARREARPDERRRDHFDERAAAAGAAFAAGAASGVPPAGEERPSLTREPDDWMTPARPPQEPGYAPPPPAYAPAPDQPPAHVDNYDDTYDDDYAPDEAYEYDAWEEPRDRRSGGSALAIVGFLGLGVLALLGGALLAGVFGGDQTGQIDPSPSPTVTIAPSTAATPTITAAPSGASASPTSSREPAASGEPVVFGDGAVFEVQACATNEMSFDGCNQEADLLSGGSFVAWIGFSGASGDDTLVLVLRQNGAAVADSEFDLGGAPFSCTSDCTGYARQGFTGIPPGEYTVEILRNGEPAHSIEIGID